MLLKQVTLESFLAFHDVTVEFAPGFNVVLSPNEGGKSSLFRGIVAGLYADSASRKNDLLALARWGSGGHFRIELRLQLAGLWYRLVRDFGMREQAIFRDGEDRPFAKGKGVDDFLGGSLPLGDQDLFLRVCGVCHEELGAVGDSSSAIGERLEEILGGGWGNMTPARVRSIVETKRQELLRGANRPAHEENWGPVKRHSENVARAELELAGATEASRRRERLLKESAIARGEIEKIGAELEILRSRRQKGARYAELEAGETAARAKAEEIRKRMDRLKELLMRKRTLLGEAARFPSTLRERDGASLNEIIRALEVEAILRGETDGAAPERGRPERHAGFIVSAALILAGAAGTLLLNKYMLLLLAAGIILLGWYVRKGAVPGRAPSVPSKRGELERLEDLRHSWSGVRSLPDSRMLLDGFLAWSEAMKDVQTRLEEFSGERHGASEDLAARLDADYGGAALEARAFAEERSTLEAFRTDSSGLLRLDHEIRLKEDEMATATAFVEARERELAGLEAGNANAALERLEVERERLQRAERRVETLDLLLEILDEARSEVSNRLVDRLPPLAAAHCARMTLGRYAALFIDPLRMEIETMPAAGDTDAGADASRASTRIGPDAVSQGARDQIYFAVRLALVELLSRGEPPPLFLDDPFVHFDPERRERAVELLREFAGRHQVILFTCDPRYAEKSVNLIELPSRA